MVLKMHRVHLDRSRRGQEAREIGVPNFRYCRRLRLSREQNGEQILACTHESGAVVRLDRLGGASRHQPRNGNDEIAFAIGKPLASACSRVFSRRPVAPIRARASAA